MAKGNQELTNDIRRIDQYVSGIANQLQGQGGVLQTLQQYGGVIQGLLLQQANQQPSPVANLLWNGELGHSVFTWNTIPPPTTPGTATETAQNEECQQFYSHNIPATAQDFTTITSNDQIPLPDHDFTTGCTVDFFNDGDTLPTGLAFSTTYFVYVLNPNVVQLATTAALAFAGTPDVTITAGTGTGTHRIQQVLLETNSLTSTTQNALKTTAHVNYDPHFCAWDSEDGQADLTGTFTVDALMPTNNIDATTPLARVSMIAARRSPYIEIPEESLIGAGIWDNTSGQRKFLTGDIGFTAQTVGTPGTTHRNFRILLSSDRGFSLLSDEIEIINAPADGAFSSTSNIAMSWKQQAGQLQVSIYEHYDPSGVSEYRLIADISSSTSFVYEGGYLEVVSGYPTPTGTQLTATYFTNTGDASDLAIDGVSAAWDTVNFPIAVPDTYDKANTTDRQWVRMWMTTAPNLYIPSNVTSNGTTTITVPTGILDVAQYGTGTTSLYATLEVQVFNSLGAQTATSTVVSVTNETDIVLADAITTATNQQIRIVGGGFHGVLIDKVHLGYQQGTSYAPNALDVRSLQPLAAPNGSSQGGVGSGGTGGGVVSCIAEDTPIKTFTGWKQIRYCSPGEHWAAGSLKPNLLLKLRSSMCEVRKVTTANGCEIICTDTERFMVDSRDYRGTPLYMLRVGDAVLTEVDDRIVLSKITEITPYLGKRLVYTPSLSDSHLFIAGAIRQKWWKRQVSGGFVLHNAKPIPT